MRLLKTSFMTAGRKPGGLRYSTMRNIRLLYWLLVAGLLSAQPREAPERLVARALGNTPIFDDLQELCDRIGGRPTGSPGAYRAIEWGSQKFQAAGLHPVLESFQIPNLWLPVSAEASAVAPEQFPIRLAAAPFTASTAGAIEAP